ncbi:unnamed protein product [Alternaria alternata]
MTFQLVAAHLPIELLLMVLKEWIGAQRVVVGNDGSLNYTLSYSNPDNPSLLFTIPKPLLRDYIRQRNHAWSTDTKEFDDPPTFYLSHLLTSLKMPDNRLASYDLSSHPLNPISQDPNLTLSTTFPINNIHKLRNILFPCLPPTHGFEKIKLDFTAEQYFALFDVQVPPFHYRDDTVTTATTSTATTTATPLASSSHTRTPSSCISAQPTSPATPGTTLRNLHGAPQIQPGPTSRLGSGLMSAIAAWLSTGYWSMRGMLGTFNVCGTLS